jgi:type I restriction enzyme S subunit
MNSYKLSDLIEICNGTKYNHLNTGSIPLYGSGGIMSYVDDFLYDGEAVLLPRKGTLNNILYTEGKIWTVDTMYYATTNTLVLPYYLYCYLSLLDLRHLDSGSALPSMTKSAYYNIEVRLPDIPVQSSVVDLVKNIDKKIELNNKINSELEATAKTIYDYWFVQFDFPDKNGNPYKSSGGKMVYNEELKRDIPEGWSDGALSDLGEIVGGSTPSTKNAANFIDHGTPWITPNDLSKNEGNKFITRGGQDITDTGVKSASLNLYPKNTVLLSSRAPIGYMAIARNELTTNQGFKSFVPTKGYSSEFIFYTVKNAMKAIVQYSSGSTFKEVSGGVLKTVKIVLPKTEVVNKYIEIVSDVFEKQNILELESKELSDLRDWLLPMLMNGQVKIK